MEDSTVPLASNYAVLVNVKAIEGGGELHLCEGHVLRRATAEQITEIQSGMETILNDRFAAMIRLKHWEAERRVRNETGNWTYVLPESEWRYFVVAFNGNNGTIVELEDVFNLSAIQLEIGFTRMRSFHNSINWNSAQMFKMAEKANMYDDVAKFYRLDASHAAEISALHAQVRKYDHKLLDLKPALAELKNLKALPDHSPLLLLGYFAVLESLLTHQPKPTDPYDSLTRQIKTKLALLHNRWPDVDYGPFEGASIETIWTKMYSCRSTVAHVGKPDYNSGELRILKNHQVALDLIMAATKAVIRRALQEPQLFRDLKQC